MKIKEYVTDGLINKDAIKDDHLIWSSDKNTKTMELMYKTFRYKNFNYYINHVHQEDYYE